MKYYEYKKYQRVLQNDDYKFIIEFGVSNYFNVTATDFKNTYYFPIPLEYDMDVSPNDVIKYGSVESVLWNRGCEYVDSLNIDYFINKFKESHEKYLKRVEKQLFIAKMKESFDNLTEKTYMELMHKMAEIMLG